MKEYLYTRLMDEVSSLSIENVIMNFVAACILSLMIFISYRVSHSGAVYSRKFNVSLVMLALVTTLVMNVIGNNIALSLGMVGALSIFQNSYQGSQRYSIYLLGNCDWYYLRCIRLCYGRNRNIHHLCIPCILRCCKR